MDGDDIMDADTSLVEDRVMAVTTSGDHDEHGFIELEDDDAEASPEEILEARMEELRFIDREGVWKPAAASEARAASGRPPVATRWVINVKRGDAGERIVRARLVAEDFRPRVGIKGRSVSDMVTAFPSMPPVEVVRVLLAHAASLQPPPGLARPETDDGVVVMVVDRRKAHIHAFCFEPAFVEYPPEANTPHGECGQLVRWLYGMR